MQRSQIDFLNHGILPFVGRQRELGAILEFWQKTAESSELRGMLLIGEAGIGKSRLLEESVRRIGSRGGVVIHVKLYPDSATSLAPLLARALARSGAAQQLLKAEPEETFPSVSAALVRICGLRPTLLVIEDVHLLHGDGLRDFARLLEGLADEPLSLLCIARPVTLAARSVLERYLTAELDLGGLSRQEIAALCTAVLGEEAGDELVDLLKEKTLGNALALRSALRAGVKLGVPTAAGVGKRSPILLSQRSFIDTLEQNVRLLSEGMAAHLTEGEKDAAEKLACLGEVFAAETAAAVLEDATGMLDALIFKGVVAPLVSPPPPVTLVRSTSPPLAFSHTLLHRHFIDQAKVDPNRLIRGMAAKLPLYSILPFSLISDHGDQVSGIDAETLRIWIQEALDVARRLDVGADWGYATTIWKAAVRISQKAQGVVDSKEATEIEIWLLTSKLALERRTPPADYAQVVERLLELTGEVRSETQAHLRVLSLLYKRRLVSREHPRESMELLKEVEDLASRFPGIRCTTAYIGHLRDSARIANRLDDHLMMSSVEKWTEELLASDDIPEEWKQVIQLRLIPHFLCEFTTPEQLHKRIEQLRRLDQATQERAAEVLIWKVNFLNTIGYLDEALKTAETAIQVYGERGLAPEVSSCMLIAIFSRIMLGEDLERQTEELRKMQEVNPPQLVRQLQPMIALSCSLVGIVADLMEWRKTFLGTIPIPPSSLPVLDRLLEALIEGDLARTGSLLDELTEDWAPTLKPLLAVATGEDASDPAGALDAPRAIFERPILDLKDVMIKRLLLELLIAAQRGTLTPRMAEAIGAELRGQLRSLMEWLADRSLSTLMNRMIERYSPFFAKGELKSWRARTAAIAATRESSVEPAGRRTKLSLLGSITIAPPGEEPVRVRGAQLCTLLGLMTADRMLARPLSVNEFITIVMGADRDPESARKSMNFAVFRLRELLGAEAISTSGETPSLNLDLVEVDLLEAHRQLRDAIGALGDGALLRAYPKLIAALDITAGQVPFPTLYDELFESLREDFETELRGGVIKIAGALLRKGDETAAEQVLNRALQGMPDDEEIAKMLQQVLRNLGKRTEATRIAMRGEEGEGR